jgi:Uri superfamily endonuclease
MLMDTPQVFRKGTGTYALVMQLARDTTIPVGGLGPVTFIAGYYVYTGSAFGPGGLAARIGRHLKSSKKCHWHIDYLRRFTEVHEVWYTFYPEKLECRWAQLFQKTRGARTLCPGFGSSDCRCDAHLFYFTRKPGIRTYRRKIEQPLFCKGMKA